MALFSLAITTIHVVVGFCQLPFIARLGASPLLAGLFVAHQRPYMDLVVGGAIGVGLSTIHNLWHHHRTLPEQMLEAEERRLMRESNVKLKDNGNPGFLFFKLLLAPFELIFELLYPPIVVPSYGSVFLSSLLFGAIPLGITAANVSLFKFISNHWVW